MILDKIAAYTRLRIEEAKKELSPDEIRRLALSCKTDTGFPFEKVLKEPGIHYICEVKKASPSKGVIAEDFPYLKIAEEYEKAGASAISCLTEPKYFMGKNVYLKEITGKVKIPVLRKDFTVDEYMIYEAKLLGASAVLLICAILDTETVRDYIHICDELGLSALVEVHDEKEMRSAIEAGARIIGVNNRNLKDFTISLDNTVRLRPMVAKEKCFVAESGIITDDDILVLKEQQVDAFLIGRALMETKDPRALADHWKSL